MAQGGSTSDERLFWGSMGALIAGAVLGAILFVVLRPHGAGWVAGLAVVLMVAALSALLLRGKTPTLTAPSGSATAATPPAAAAAPGGGSAALASGGASVAVEPAQAATAAPLAATAPVAARDDLGSDAAAGKASFTASAAVTSAAQAAREAMAGVAGPISAPRPPAIQPESREAPRDGGADDLKRIRGVGPKLEELLHGLGVFHFDQIAAWGPSELAWVDTHLEGFHGRASRDGWVGQARLLAAGADAAGRGGPGDVF